MRVLSFSDLHAHAFKPYSVDLPGGMNSRLLDALNILEQIGQLATAHKVDLILFAGDLFHARGSINVRTFNAVFGAVAKLKLGRQLGLLPGNHDQSNKTGDVHSIYALGSIATVMDTAGWTVFEGSLDPMDRLEVLAIPYTSDRERILASIELQLQHQPNWPRLLLGHFGVDGAEVGSNFVLVDDLLPKAQDLHPEQFSQVFLGHYHEPQQLLQNVHYLGATHQHNWGDTGSVRGCWLWDTDPRGQFGIPQFTTLEAPRFLQYRYEDLAINAHIDVQDSFVRILAPEEDPPNKEVWNNRMMQSNARTVEWVVDKVDPLTGGHAGYDPGSDMEDLVAQWVDEGVIDPHLDVAELKRLGRKFIQQVE